MVLNDTARQRLNSIKLHTDPLVQAQMIGEYKKEFDVSNTEIAQYLDIKPSYLSHLIRILKLPEIIIDGYMSKQITFTHLVILSRLKRQEDMVAIYEEILKENMNVAQTETRIRHVLYLVDTVGKYISAERLDKIKDKISAALDGDVSVSIIQTRIKTKVILEVSGDLQKTSDFIESFSSRFRPKRGKKGAREQELKSLNTQSGEIPISHEETNDNDINSSEFLTSQELKNEKESVEPEKKYRFDPDF